MFAWKQPEFKFIYSTVWSSTKLSWDLIKKCENCFVICLLFLAGKQDFFIRILNLCLGIVFLPGVLVYLYVYLCLNNQFFCFGGA